jgi:hypothetical protein
MGGSGLLGHNHLFAFSEALSYEAHLIVEALHSVLTATYILRVFVVDELRFTVFADEHPALVIRDPVRVQGGVRPATQRANIPFVVELLGRFGLVGGTKSVYILVIYGTHVAQAGIYDTVHLGDSPLDYVAEALVVDIKVLSAHGALGPLFKLVLPMAADGFSPSWGTQVEKKKGARLY